jgi:hypothetical protein
LDSLLFYRVTEQEQTLVSRILIKVTGPEVENTSFRREGTSTELLQAGAIVNSRKTVSEFVFPSLDTFTDTFELSEFVRDESIYRFAYTSVTSEIKLRYRENSLTNSSLSSPVIFMYQFQVDENFKTFNIYPVQLTTALA